MIKKLFLLLSIFLLHNTNASFVRTNFMCKTPNAGVFFGKYFNENEYIFKIENEKNLETNFCARREDDDCVFNGTINPLEVIYMSIQSKINGVFTHTSPISNKYKGSARTNEKTFCKDVSNNNNQNAILEFAVDTSRSINNNENNKQIEVIQKVMSIVNSEMSISYSSFADEYHKFQGTYDDDISDTFMNFMNQTSRNERYTNYMPIFDNATNLPQNSVLFIASDGKPFLKRYKGGKKSRLLACKSRKNLNESRPDIKVVCFQSTKNRHVTSFYKCACDGVWLSNGDDYDVDFVADQIKNFILSYKITNKPKNPCLGTNSQNTCENIKRMNDGGTPVTIMEMSATPHCEWKDKKCAVKKNFVPIYQNDDF